MERLHKLLLTHPARVWLLTVAVFGILLVGLGAVPNAAPEQWEYKAVYFRFNAGDKDAIVQQQFTAALNREAAAGWEFCGRCAHCNALEWWTDFVVFRRPRG